MIISLEPKRIVPWKTFEQMPEVTRNEYLATCVGFMVVLDVYEQDHFLTNWRESGTPASLNACTYLRLTSSKLRHQPNLNINGKAYAL
jgi:hypothetical protein